MLSNKSGKLKVHSQKFFRTLKETQDYQQAIDAFTEKVPISTLQDYLIKVRADGGQSALISGRSRAGRWLGWCRRPA